MKNKEILSTLYKQSIEIANKILNEEIGILDGARQIDSMRFKIYRETGSFDDEFNMFIGVSSEGDEFPDPKTHQFWNAQELEKIKIEQVKFEANYKDGIQNACHQWHSN